jgi:hypothetical protein
VLSDRVILWCEDKDQIVVHTFRVYRSLADQEVREGDDCVLLSGLEGNLPARRYNLSFQASTLKRAIHQNTDPLFN